MPETSERPWSDIVSFWRQAGEDKWFGKDALFDDACRDHFRALHMDVAARRHDDWMDCAEGALALILLTDQIPRNIFRGTAHMFATDPLARHYARRALAAGYPGQVDADLRVFFALPFTHSEDMADQAISVALTMALVGTSEWADGHRDIVRRFGRFPHRNALLLRETTTAEAEFLAEGGFAG
jgi:uncharacterized protein (DUF924 family)